MNILTIKNLKKSFKEKEVLKGINLEIPKGAIFGLVGENGSGKTTIMKSILGLLKIDDGKIYVNDIKVTFGENKTNKYIGYVPDVPEFYSYMKAKEYLYYSAEVMGIKKSEIKNKTSEVLKLVSLENENHKIGNFSRGMKQRLAIAQSLLGNPELLICDEPTSALDPIGRKQVLDILLKIKDKTTVILSTHILSDIERISTDIAFLSDGIIKIQGKIDDIKNKYRKNSYLLKTENDEDLKILASHFPKMKLADNIIFDENDVDIYTLLNFISSKKISITKLERIETSLENLFMEVVKK